MKSILFILSITLISCNPPLKATDKEDKDAKPRSNRVSVVLPPVIPVLTEQEQNEAILRHDLVEQRMNEKIQQLEDDRVTFDTINCFTIDPSGVVRIKEGAVFTKIVINGAVLNGAIVNGYLVIKMDSTIQQPTGL